jgi:DNA polymerase-4
MNAFFISCEMTRDPSLRGVPAAVAGDPKRRTGIVLAANYEARAFGVKTAMVLGEALRLCPKMRLVPPDHEFYGQRSGQVMELLANYTPVLEQNSVDEAWLDMTGTESLFGTPAQAARRIMDEIEEKLGLWCSIGISENRFLSKMASEMKKPRGITELWPEDVPAKMWPLPVRAMYGVGGKTAERLAGVGVKTVGDLARQDPAFLEGLLGAYGPELHRLANGVDDSPVEARREDEMKSIGRETTLPHDVSDVEEAKVILMELLEDVAATARRHGKKGCTVQLTYKYSDFKRATRQMTVPATNATREIYAAVCEILERTWDPKKPARLLGVTLTGFDEACGPEQVSLFDLAPAEDAARQARKARGERDGRIDQAIDGIREKHGDAIITRAKLIKKERPEEH